MPIKIHKNTLTEVDKKYLSDDDDTLAEGFVAGNYIRSSQVNAALHQLTIAAKALLKAVGSDDEFDQTASSDDVQSIANTILSNIKNIEVSNATHATAADKLTDTTIGSADNPVYISEGTPKAADLYAGGTLVKLNGTNKASESINIYAPTCSGTAAATCVMNSSCSNPVWVSLFDQNVTMTASSTTTFYNSTDIYYTATNSGCSAAAASATYYTSTSDIAACIKSATCIVKRSITSESTTSYTYIGHITLSDSAINWSDRWIRLMVSTHRTIKYATVTPTFKSTSSLDGAGRTMPYVIFSNDRTVYVGKDTNDSVFDGFTFEIICD